MKRLLTLSAILLALLYLSACSTKRPFPAYPNVSMRKIEAEQTSWYCYTKDDAMAMADWEDRVERFRRAYEK